MLHKISIKMYLKKVVKHKIIIKLITHKKSLCPYCLKTHWILNLKSSPFFLQPAFKQKGSTVDSNCTVLFYNML